MAKTVSAASGGGGARIRDGPGEGFDGQPGDKKGEGRHGAASLLGATVGTTSMWAVQQQSGQEREGASGEAVGKQETAVKTEAIGKPAADPERVGDGHAGEAVPPVGYSVSGALGSNMARR